MKPSVEQVQPSAGAIDLMVPSDRKRAFSASGAAVSMAPMVDGKFMSAFVRAQKPGRR
jgi:hypothetical protein